MSSILQSNDDANFDLKRGNHQLRQCCCSGKHSIGNPCGHPVGGGDFPAFLTCISAARLLLPLLSRQNEPVAFERRWKRKEEEGCLEAGERGKATNKVVRSRAVLPVCVPWSAC